jgi:uncharacterized protein (DUF1330 family)
LPAYIISRVLIRNAETMQQYMTEAPTTVYAFGGKYLVRGNDVQALEGVWEHDRMVVVEFPNKEAALGWYNSPEYAPLRALRQKSADAVILLAAGTTTKLTD